MRRAMRVGEHQPVTGCVQGTVGPEEHAYPRGAEELQLGQVEGDFAGGRHSATD